MSQQSGDFGQKEITKDKTASKKRRGPWEVWTIMKSWREGQNWVFMQRDYATKELAEEAAAKWRRDKIYENVEIRYNERKE